jgi:anti-sigma factor RsiW
VDVNGHVTELLALAAAGALERDEQARVDAHLAECPDCAAEAERWRGLAGGLRELPTPTVAAGLVARTRAAVERAQAEREERAWNRAALGFLVVFGWTLGVVVWFIFDLLLGEAAVRLDRSLGSTALWFGLYLAAGWMAAAAATVLLGRQAREEGRLA